MIWLNGMNYNTNHTLIKSVRGTISASRRFHLFTSSIEPSNYAEVTMLFFCFVSVFIESYDHTVFRGTRNVVAESIWRWLLLEISARNTIIYQCAVNWSPQCPGSETESRGGTRAEPIGNFVTSAKSCSRFGS